MARLLTVLGDEELTTTDRVVYAAIHAATAMVEEFVAEAGAPTPEELLNSPWRARAGFEMNILCRYTGLKPLAARRAIKRLEARGWLTGTYHPKSFDWTFTLHETRQEVPALG